MGEAAASIHMLAKEVEAAYTKLNMASQLAEQTELQAESSQPNFWDNSDQAQAKMKQLARLQSRTQPWVELVAGIKELETLADLGDSSLEAEIKQQLTKYSQQFDTLKQQLAFSGLYDGHDAILSIHAGAGGTDAQDWAQMLLRMYTRWTEAGGGKPELIEQSSGDEAGIKSATISIAVPFAFGKLKGEHGVHRLVRLSPFNSDNLRQTSFAKVDVLPKIDTPEELAIDDKDLKVDVFRAGGHGGQSVNTTDSAVRVTHIPSGITVSIQNERSQLQNRETALTILRSRLVQLQIEQHKEKLEDIKGPNQSAEWGSQIRSYVLHPYKQVKDLRTRYETSDPQSVLDGDLGPLIAAYSEYTLSQD